MIWTPELKRVYGKFPASYRSASWPEIVKAAAAGEMDRAMALAKDNQDRSPRLKAENIMARRMRIERMGLFALQDAAEARAREIFTAAAQACQAATAARADRASQLPWIRKRVHAAIVTLRRDMNKWITDLIWESIKLGFKNMNAAVGPILKDNQESFVDVVLTEERLSFFMRAELARKAKVPDLGSDKWSGVMDSIYTKIVKQNNQGLQPSERVWDTTNSAELEIRRILVREISQGASARDIGKSVFDYLSPDVVAGAGGLGSGVYRNPFKNAMRLARTESSNAHVRATASWAAGKDWVEGIRATLSGAHVEEDECDDTAGEIFTPDDFASIYPKHPHCLIAETPVEAYEVLGALRARYDGPVIEITLSGGRRFTVTPNHMVMTPMGLAVASKLRAGDDVIDSPLANGVPGVYPNDNRRPAMIAEVFESLRKTPGMTTARMPVSAKDLHGDARFGDCHIDIVCPDSFLKVRPEITSRQKFRQATFMATYSQLPRLSRERDLAIMLNGIARSTPGNKSGLGKATAFRRRHPLVTNGHGLSESSRANTITKQKFSDDDAANASKLGKFILMNPGKVSTAKVTLVKVRHYSGHVYDLQTKSALYLAEGVIIHNCMCFGVVVPKEEYLVDDQAGEQAA